MLTPDEEAYRADAAAFYARPRGIYPVPKFLQRFENRVEQAWVRRWDRLYDERMDGHLTPHDICHPSVTDRTPPVRCRTHGGSYPGYGRCPLAPPATVEGDAR